MAWGLVLAPSAPAADAPPAGSGIHYVYLIRHGVYDRVSDADDVTANGLNALGHEQARILGERLGGLPVRPASLVTSTYRRARETAEGIGRLLDMVTSPDSLLRECTPASHRSELMRDHTATEVAACDSNLSQAWREYLVPSPAADRHDVLVCHGNVIRWFVCRAIAGDPRRWATMDIGNASLTILAVRPDGTVRLVCFSDVGHLPVAKQTWAGAGAGWGAPAKR